jgi:hypothetical protein
MSVSLGTMLPGEKINFSLDLVNLIPAGQTLSSATVTTRQGSSAISFTNVGINGSKAVFRAEALTVGRVIADVIGTFSDGQIDGDQIEIAII